MKVSGQACGRVLTGSGFAVDTETIVTNAHVVAGVDGPSVIRPDGRRLSATVVVFDPNRDLAVLVGARPGPGAPARGDGRDRHRRRRLRPSRAVRTRWRSRPARIEAAINALGRDLYGSRTIRRDIYILAAQLEPGDSGGALVDTDGEVVGVAFAVAPDQPATAYALASTRSSTPCSACPGRAPSTPAPASR